MLSKFFIVAALLPFAALAQSSFECPDEFEGYYPHDTSCDKYWECKEGVSTLETCGNGLAFDDLDPTYTTKNCDYEYNVECGARTELEPPISAPNCPRLYGTFEDPDDCTGFFNCRDGHANRFSCAPGLAYDRQSRVCKWADRVDSCKKEKEEAGEDPDVFSCPTNVPVGIFTKHAHPEDCRQYFVCIAGIPREYGCPIGTVFKVGADDFEGQCANPEDVPECKNYYGDLEFNKQELVKSGADPEAVGAEVIPVPRARVAVAQPKPKPKPVQQRIVEVEEVVVNNNPPPPRKNTVSSNSFRTRNRPAPAVPSRSRPRPQPVTTTTTTTTPPPPPPPARPTRVEVPALPLVSSSPSGKPALGQPAKVKAGEDYYYYYYYYDDDYDQADAAGANAAAAASTA